MKHRLSTGLKALWIQPFLIALAIIVSVPQAQGGEMKNQVDQVDKVDQVKKAVDAFNRLSKDNMSVVDEFYDENVVFQDPIHHIEGREALKKYYAGLYVNVESIRFDFSKFISQGSTHVLVWTMHLKTPHLNGGNPFTLDGNSVIEFGPSGKVIYHRDYFDMGEFIYERIPILNRLVRFIRQKMSGH